MPAVADTRIDDEIVMILLANGTLRAMDLEAKIRKFEILSGQVLYNHLKKLIKDGYVEKIKLGRRNVQYKLTPKGEALAKKECLKSNEARAALISILNSLPNSQNIAIECVMRDLMEKIPEKFKLPEVEAKLKNFMTEEIEFLKKKILFITSLNYP